MRWRKNIDLSVLIFHPCDLAEKTVLQRHGIFADNQGLELKNDNLLITVIELFATQWDLIISCGTYFSEWVSLSHVGSSHPRFCSDFLQRWTAASDWRNSQNSETAYLLNTVILEGALLLLVIWIPRFVAENNKHSKTDNHETNQLINLVVHSMQWESSLRTLLSSDYIQSDGVCTSIQFKEKLAGRMP